MPPLACFDAILGVYRSGVESRSASFCPVTEGVGRTASSKFTPRTDDSRSKEEQHICQLFAHTLSP